MSNRSQVLACMDKGIAKNKVERCKKGGEKAVRSQQVAGCSGVVRVKVLFL